MSISRGEFFRTLPDALGTADLIVSGNRISLGASGRATRSCSWKRRRCGSRRLRFRLQAIQGPRLYSEESLPAGPAWSDVQRMLADMRSDYAQDVRDRAIVMLLAIYGLRVSEVTTLRLEDLDWERDLLHVARAKRRERQSYPLLPSVGSAIIQYLQTVRRSSTHREVFLTLHSPFRPLSRSALYSMVCKRLTRLGIRTAHRGPHSLRHACAARLVAEGLTLKEIGDHLGHRVGGSERIAYVEASGGTTSPDLDQGCLLQLIICLLFVLICPPLMLGCRIPISTQPGPIGLGLCRHRSLACFGPSGGGIASGAAKRQIGITDMPAFAEVELTFISAALRALPNSGFSFHLRCSTKKGQRFRPGRRPESSGPGCIAFASAGRSRTGSQFRLAAISPRRAARHSPPLIRFAH